MAAQYTGSSGHLEWQIINLHSDVVAMRTAGAIGITATYVTDEYGKSESTSTPLYGYLGNAQRSADNPGGFITMGVRLYNSTTGRFTSTDSVYGANANPYDYCSGNPVTCADTNGRDPHADLSAPLTHGFLQRASRLHKSTQKPPSRQYAGLGFPAVVHQNLFQTTLWDSISLRRARGMTSGIATTRSKAASMKTIAEELITNSGMTCSIFAQPMSLLNNATGWLGSTTIL